MKVVPNFLRVIAVLFGPTNRLQFALAVLLSTAIPAALAQPEWWIEQKRECGLPADTIYNVWRDEGMPCNSVQSQEYQRIDEANAYARQGYTAEKAGQYDRAIQLLAEAYATWPDQEFLKAKKSMLGEKYYALASEAQDQGDYDKAVQLYGEAYKSDPWPGYLKDKAGALADLYSAQADAAFNAGDFDGAARLYQQAYDTDPSPGYLKNKSIAIGRKYSSEADAAFNARDYTRAANLYGLAYGADQSAGYLGNEYDAEAEAARKAGNYRRAAGLYDQAYEADPDKVYLDNKKGLLAEWADSDADAALRRGNYDRAAQLFARAYANDPWPGYLKGRNAAIGDKYDAQGGAAFDAGDYNKAARLYAKANSTSPRAAFLGNAYNAQAEAAAAAGNYDRAIALFDKAYAADHDQAYLDNRNSVIANRYVRSGDTAFNSSDFSRSAHAYEKAYAASHWPGYLGAAKEAWANTYIATAKRISESDPRIASKDIGVAIARLKEALKIYTAAEAANPKQDFSDKVTDLHHTMAKLYDWQAGIAEQAGNHAKALALWKNAYANDPKEEYRVDIADSASNVKDDINRRRYEKQISVAAVSNAYDRLGSMAASAFATLRGIVSGREGMFNTVGTPLISGLSPQRPASVPADGAGQQASNANRSGKHAINKATSLEQMKAESGCQFDTAACMHGRPVVYPRPVYQTPATAELASHIPLNARQDRIIKGQLAWYEKLEKRNSEAVQELVHDQKRIRNGHGDKKKLTLDIAQLRTDIERNAKDQKRAKANIKKQLVNLKIEWIVTPAPDIPSATPSQPGTARHD